MPINWWALGPILGLVAFVGCGILWLFFEDAEQREEEQRRQRMVRRWIDDDR